MRSAETFRDYKYLGTRFRVDGTIGEYKWMTYGEAATACSTIGSGLVSYGIQKKSCEGQYFINRPEWIIVDHACSAYSYISVPLYDTLGPDAVKFVVNPATVQAIFCVPQTLNILLSFLSEILSLRLIVVVGRTEDRMSLLPSATRVEIMSYSKLINQGQSNLQPFCPPKPVDIAIIYYTSGTTGKQKGVVLSHGSLIANVAGASVILILNHSDVYISYLPLAHINERYNQVLVEYYGTAIGFYQGNNLKLMDDVVTLSIPRLLNKIYADFGRQVHGVVVKYGLDPLAYMKNYVMDMYCKCGLFEDAFNFIQTTEDKDVITWNVIVIRCVQKENCEEACYYFWAMRSEVIYANEALFSTALYVVATC